MYQHGTRIGRERNSRPKHVTACTLIVTEEFCMRLHSSACVHLHLHALAVRMHLESRRKRISVSRYIFCSRTFGTYYTQALHASGKHKACKPHHILHGLQDYYCTTNFPVWHMKSCISLNICSSQSRDCVAHSQNPEIAQAITGLHNTCAQSRDCVTHVCNLEIV